MGDTGPARTFDPEEHATRRDEDDVEHEADDTDEEEAKDATAAMMADADVPPMAACRWGCAAKYVWRWPHKGATPPERARDPRKAVECPTGCERAHTAHVAAQRAKVAAMVGEVGRWR